jgi:hypothetical protein
MPGSENQSAGHTHFIELSENLLQNQVQEYAIMPGRPNVPHLHLGVEPMHAFMSGSSLTKTNGLIYYLGAKQQNIISPGLLITMPFCKFHRCNCNSNSAQTHKHTYTHLHIPHADTHTRTQNRTSPGHTFSLVDISSCFVATYLSVASLS